MNSLGSSFDDNDSENSGSDNSSEDGSGSSLVSTRSDPNNCELSICNEEGSTRSSTLQTPSIPPVNNVHEYVVDGAFMTKYRNKTFTHTASSDSNFDLSQTFDTPSQLTSAMESYSSKLGFIISDKRKVYFKEEQFTSAFANNEPFQKVSYRGFFYCSPKSKCRDKGKIRNLFKALVYVPSNFALFYFQGLLVHSRSVTATTQDCLHTLFVPTPNYVTPIIFHRR